MLPSLDVNQQKKEIKYVLRIIRKEYDYLNCSLEVTHFELFTRRDPF